MLGRHNEELSVELRHLRYFVAAAETGSLSVAAEKRLHTSQPSLSRQIRDLEDEVGAQLLRRSVRGVEPTAAGLAFLEYALRALADVDRAVEAAQKAVRPTQLRVGFLAGLEMSLLAKLLPLFRELQPAGDIVLSSGYSPDLAEAVERGEIDLAFCREEPGRDVEYRAVGTQEIVVLLECSHPLASKSSLAIEDLDGQTLVAMGIKAPAVAAVVDGIISRMGSRMTTSQRADNPAQVISLVASTHAVALVPDYFSPLLPSTLCVRPLTERPTIGLMLAFRRGASADLEVLLSRLTAPA